MGCRIRWISLFGDERVCCRGSWGTCNDTWLDDAAELADASEAATATAGTGTGGNAVGVDADVDADILVVLLESKSRGKGWWWGHDTCQPLTRNSTCGTVIVGQVQSDFNKYLFFQE